MNRWDEINATAKDVADWVCADEQDRNKMADDLIKLVTLIVAATGKIVAGDGESDIGQGDCTCDRPEGCSGGCVNPMHDAKAHNRYLMGERMQDAAREVQQEASHDGADLERWTRGGGAPVWQPRGNARRLASAVAAHARKQSVDGVASLLRMLAPPHPRTGRLSKAAQAAVDKLLATSQLGPARLNVRGNCFNCGHELGHKPGCHVGASEQQDAASDTFQGHVDRAVRAALVCDAQDCPAHGDAGRVGPCLRNQPDEQDTTTFTTWDGRVLRTVPQPRRHTMVTATDGDTGATLDYQHCGVCGARCSCTTGSPDNYEGPDVDCPEHGDEIATRCTGVWNT